MSTPLTLRPYPGLRPFDTEESDIFFGRERQTDELLARLQKHRQLAIVGPSGCGKSSLVRAGMIPALQSGFVTDSGSNWHVAQMRPGERPILRLAEAMLAPSLLGAQRGEGPDSALYLNAALKRGPLSLVEVARESGLCRDTNLLLLVDQFEELFRFRQQANVDEAEAFVSLLLATAAQRELPIYVVITMRSDFLGECTLFRGLPEAINDSQYLTPRLTREECAAAITGPAQVFGGTVEPALLNRLLNDFGSDPDQLPLLQHALMRMWELSAPAAGGTTTPAVALSVRDYERIGGLQESLSRHGDEVLSGLSPAQRRVAEIMFRRLVHFSSGRRDMRASARLSEVAAIAAVPDSEIASVVEVFRSPACSFIASREGPLESDMLLDIGHESLIRKWTTLSGWVKDEADAVGTYRRLRETALLWKQGKAALWRSPDLELAVAWRARVKPREPWAARYGEAGDLDVALEFLDVSENQQHLEQAREQIERERRLRRAVWATGVSGVIAGVLICAGLLYYYLYMREYVQYFGGFLKQFGQPVGIGALSASETGHRRVSFKIVKQGRWGNVLRVVSVNARNQPTGRHGVGTYRKATTVSWFAEPDQVVRWEFVYDPNGNVTTETALDIRGNVVWRFVYMPESDDGTGRQSIRRGYYVGPTGLPRARSEEQKTIFEIHYAEDGREERVLFRNRIGLLILDSDWAYGKEYHYDDAITTGPVKITSLDLDQKPMVDKVGNASLRSSRFDRFGTAREVMALDAKQEPVAIKPAYGGWAILRRETDDYGRITQESYFNKDGKPILHGANKYHQFRTEYDSRGNAIKETYWDIAGGPTADQNYCHGYALEFDDRDRLVRHACQGPDGRAVPNRDHFAILTYGYDDRDFLIEKRFFDPDGKPTFFTDGDPKKKPGNKEDGYAGVKYRRDDQGRVKETSYFGVGQDDPLISTRQGYARMVNEYDKESHVLSKAFFGPDLQPVLVRDGYAKWRQDYDPYGNIVHTRYFGTDDNRVLAETSDGKVSGWSANYDANGNEIERIYVDQVDRPMTRADATAGWRADYDVQGNKIRTTYIGRHKEPVEDQTGVAQVEYQYDRQTNNQTGAKYFDRYGRRVIGGVDKVSGWKRTYNRSGRLSEIVYLNKADELRKSPSKGYAVVRFEYDKHAQQTRELYFDTERRSTISSENIAGIEAAWDDSGNITELKHLDVNLNLREARSRQDGGPRFFALVQSKYDTRGNLLERAYYGANSKPKVPPGINCARLVWEYDASGRDISESCYGTNKTLIERAEPGGYKKRVTTYDSRGYPAETRYLGPNDRPASAWEDTVPFGQFMTKSEYDRFGNLVEEQYFDKNGRRVSGYSRYGEHCFRWTANYDDQGRMKPSRGECHQQE